MANTSMPGEGSVQESLNLALRCYELLAYALADFHGDLAAADGMAYNPMAVDSRLGALTVRSVAALVRWYGKEQPGLAAAAIDGLADWLERGADQALSPAAAPASER